MSSPSVVVCAVGTVSTTTVENVAGIPSLFVVVTMFVVVIEFMLETAVSLNWEYSRPYLHLMFQRLELL
jgi:hypothetical protein